MNIENWTTRFVCWLVCRWTSTGQWKGKSAGMHGEEILQPILCPLCSLSAIKSFFRVRCFTVHARLSIFSLRSTLFCCTALLHEFTLKYSFVPFVVHTVPFLLKSWSGPGTSLALNTCLYDIGTFMLAGTSVSWFEIVWESNSKTHFINKTS